MKLEAAIAQGKSGLIAYIKDRIENQESAVLHIVTKKLRRQQYLGNDVDIQSQALQLAKSICFQKIVCQIQSEIAAINVKLSSACDEMQESDTDAYESLSFSSETFMSIEDTASLFRQLIHDSEYAIDQLNQMCPLDLNGNPDWKLLLENLITCVTNKREDAVHLLFKVVDTIEDDRVIDVFMLLCERVQIWFQSTECCNETVLFELCRMVHMLSFKLPMFWHSIEHERVDELMKKYFLLQRSFRRGRIPSHSLASIDPEAKWFRLWITHCPCLMRLLSLLVHTGLLQDIVNRVRFRGDPEIYEAKSSIHLPPQLTSALCVQSIYMLGLIFSKSKSRKCLPIHTLRHGTIGVLPGRDWHEAVDSIPDLVSLDMTDLARIFVESAGSSPSPSIMKGIVLAVKGFVSHQEIENEIVKLDQPLVKINLLTALCCQGTRSARIYDMAWQTVIETLGEEQNRFSVEVIELLNSLNYVLASPEFQQRNPRILDFISSRIDDPPQLVDALVRAQTAYSSTTKGMAELFESDCCPLFLLGYLEKQNWLQARSFRQLLVSFHQGAKLLMSSPWLSKTLDSISISLDVLQVAELIKSPTLRHPFDDLCAVFSSEYALQAVNVSGGVDDILNKLSHDDLRMRLLVSAAVSFRNADTVHRWIDSDDPYVTEKKIMEDCINSLLHGYPNDDLITESGLLLPRGALLSDRGNPASVIKEPEVMETYSIQQLLRHPLFSTNLDRETASTFASCIIRNLRNLHDRICIPERDMKTRSIISLAREQYGFSIKELDATDFFSATIIIVLRHDPSSAILKELTRKSSFSVAKPWTSTLLLAHFVELILEQHEPKLYNALKRTFCPISGIISRWQNQCFWNTLHWQQVLQYCVLSVVGGLNSQVLFFVGLFKHLERKLRQLAVQSVGIDIILTIPLEDFILDLEYMAILETKIGFEFEIFDKAF